MYLRRCRRRASGELPHGTGSSPARGRLLGQNNRAAGLFKIDVKDNDGRAELVWFGQRLTPGVSGRLFLRAATCNITDWTAEELWKAYIQLTEAEAAFRITKKRSVDPSDTSRERSSPKVGAQIQMVDVVLPTRTGVKIRRRCVSQPTKHQAILLG